MEALLLPAAAVEALADAAAELLGVILKPNAEAEVEAPPPPPLTTTLLRLEAEALGRLLAVVMVLLMA